MKRQLSVLPKADQRERYIRLLSTVVHGFEEVIEAYDVYAAETGSEAYAKLGDLAHSTSVEFQQYLPMEQARRDRKGAWPVDT